MSKRDTTTKAPTWLRIAYYVGVVLAAVFLVVSILSWNVPLAICAFVLAILLARNLDIVGADVDRPARSTADRA